MGPLELKVSVPHKNSADGCRNIGISNNVGAVKPFLSTQLHALVEERHFALVDGLRLPTWPRF